MAQVADASGLCVVADRFDHGIAVLGVGLCDLAIFGMHTFGASAPLKELMKKFGFEPDNVVRVAKEVLGRT